MLFDGSTPHNCIILDACCVISLYASGRMGEILEAVPKSVAIAAYVKDKETMRVYDGPSDNVRETSIKIDLQPLIDAGLLIVAFLETEDEKRSYISFAARLDDGEAITGAIAVNRNWAIGTDDRAAISLFQRAAPELRLVATLDFVKHWVDTQNPSKDTISAALLDVRARGNYEPGRNHHLYEWWQEHTVFE